MFAVAVVPAVFPVAVAADVGVLVLAEPRRQPPGFNPHPRAVVVVGPVVIAIVVEVVVAAEVDNIVGCSH
jgi:hypothetical protein